MRIIALILLALMCFALAGCPGDEETGGTQPGQGENTSNTDSSGEEAWDGGGE